jgi:hypothetical protein
MSQVFYTILSGRVISQGTSGTKKPTRSGRQTLSTLIPSFFARKRVLTTVEVQQRLAAAGIHVSYHAVRHAMIRRPTEYSLVELGSAKIAFKRCAK